MKVLGNQNNYTNGLIVEGSFTSLNAIPTKSHAMSHDNAIGFD
jgi:hypothetical protein